MQSIILMKMLIRLVLHLPTLEYSHFLGLSAGTGEHCILFTWDHSFFCVLSLFDVICSPVPAEGVLIFQESCGIRFHGKVFTLLTV